MLQSLSMQVRYMCHIMGIYFSVETEFHKQIWRRRILGSVTAAILGQSKLLFNFRDSEGGINRHDKALQDH